MKFKLAFVTISLTAVSNLAALAQVENPCGGTGDPDDPTTCPLDNWVIVLVFAAIIFVTIQLYRQQKTACLGKK